MKLSIHLKIILAAIAYLIIAEILNTLSSMLTMNYYTDSNYFQVWSKIIMPGMGPPPTSFYIYSIIFSFITGLIFSFVYSRLSSVLKSKSLIQKGLKYGFGLFLISGIPFFFTSFLLVNLPLGLLSYWLIFNGLIINLIAGIAIAKIIG